jgi:hypothetical protein
MATDDFAVHLGHNVAAHFVGRGFGALCYKETIPAVMTELPANDERGQFRGVRAQPEA